MRYLHRRAALAASNVAVHARCAGAEISADAVARIHVEVDHVRDYSLLPLARSFIGIAASVLIVASAALWFMRPDPASAPQPWEGAMLASQNTDLSASANPSNGNTLEPDLIVADLSRSRRP